jgi:hypothetical protein
MSAGTGGHVSPTYPDKEIRKTASSPSKHLTAIGGCRNISQTCPKTQDGVSVSFIQSVPAVTGNEILKGKHMKHIVNNYQRGKVEHFMREHTHTRT